MFAFKTLQRVVYYPFIAFQFSNLYYQGRNGSDRIVREPYKTIGASRGPERDSSNPDRTGIHMDGLYGRIIG